MPGASTSIGASIVARLLQLRTADVASLPIVTLSTQALATAPPDAGLSVTCIHVAQNRNFRNLPRTGAVAPQAFDLQFLIAAWPGAAVEEEAAVLWAMEAIARNPLLPGATLARLVITDLDREAMAGVWQAYSRPARLGFVATAHGVTAQNFNDGRG